MLGFLLLIFVSSWPPLSSLATLLDPCPRCHILPLQLFLNVGISRVVINSRLALLLVTFVGTSLVLPLILYETLCLWFSSHQFWFLPHMLNVTRLLFSWHLHGILQVYISWWGAFHPKHSFRHFSCAMVNHFSECCNGNKVSCWGLSISMYLLFTLEMALQLCIVGVLGSDDAYYLHYQLL